MSFLCIKWMLNKMFPSNAMEAKKLQEKMASQVITMPFGMKDLHTILGMDVSLNPFDPMQRIFGAVALCSYPALELIETQTVMQRAPFPYIPGLLGFREAPVLIECYKKLSITPDLIMVDGHGVSHPRGLGIASHIGVMLDMPTIGVAKSILVGTPAYPLSPEVGSLAPLIWKNKEIGMLLRTKKRCNPLIISVGHKITLEEAIEFVFYSLNRRRLPIPTLQAHLEANKARQKHHVSSKISISSLNS